MSKYVASNRLLGIDWNFILGINLFFSSIKVESVQSIKKWPN